MKNQHTAFLIILGFSILLAGCPVSVKVAPGYPGTEKIDKDLIGTWHTDRTDPEVSTIVIEAVDKYKMKATVTEEGSMYSLETKDLEAWCTEVGGMKVVYFSPVNATEPEYYTYFYKMDGDRLETYVVSLLDGGIDSVTSTENYRSQLETSMKMSGGISDTTVWMKR